MTRLNITIPDNIAKELESIYNKSKFIAEVLDKELKEIKQRKLDQLLVKGYQKTKDEDLQVNTEWEKITLENWSN